jgi:hypothetical protein
MAQDASPRFALPFLIAAQAQKEVFHNEALSRIDILAHASVETALLNTPPSSPVAGQCWLVATGGSGNWAGYDGNIAAWTDGGWRFVAPRQGMRVWAVDDQCVWIYGLSGWHLDSVRPDGIYVAGQQIIGPRSGAIADVAGGSTIDTQSRTAVNAILAALRIHGLID